MQFYPTLPIVQLPRRASSDDNPSKNNAFLNESIFNHSIYKPAAGSLSFSKIISPAPLQRTNGL